MTREESDLRERYLALLEGLKHARQQGNLSLSDHQRSTRNSKRSMSTGRA